MAKSICAFLQKPANILKALAQGILHPLLSELFGIQIPKQIQTKNYDKNNPCWSVKPGLNSDGNKFWSILEGKSMESVVVVGHPGGGIISVERGSASALKGTIVEVEYWNAKDWNISIEIIF